MKLSRWQADLALGCAGLIWGFGFVAQKTALDHLGPFTFVALRFLLSAIIVLPFVFHENAFSRVKNQLSVEKNLRKVLLLCVAFAGAVLLQQYGMQSTTVTNTAFLTGLYVVMVPFVSYFLFRHSLSLPILIASVLSVFGVWLLSGGQIENLTAHLGTGDGLVILCACGYALHVALMGRIASKFAAPFFLSCIQYAGVGLIALVLALELETIDLKAIADAWIAIAFAGVASGGIAYTLQSVAQQHTPSADAAIILSSEALFGGIGGVWLLKDPVTLHGILGCCAIMAAIALVELGPLWRWGLHYAAKKSTAKRR